MISLRAYNREIEQLIDNGLYDESIAHCIHILSNFPKCIDVYRNLGKSLLEQKKYPEALDVFSRVLSAIPEDFISHVGLSIIFEDQNNLDLAIWHMEQAFDVQPSNLAIQDELKRLFGLRDGEQPTKIRLTRGALVRMYARGELFQQAITEIKSVLEEDPRRIDLEVILARMYYFSGAIDESASVCNRVLTKIPYCVEANRILQQINTDKNEAEGVTICKNRLASLDPYYQFTTSPFSEDEVTENKVQLQKLEYVSSTLNNTQIPEWLEEIADSSISKEKESFSWLNGNERIGESNPNQDVSPFSTDAFAAGAILEDKSVSSDDEIPDWMKNAGWKPNSEIDDLGSNDIFSDNSGISLSTATEFQENESDNNVDTTKTHVSSDDLASLFTELKEGNMENDDHAVNGEEEKQFPPSDWMSQFSNSNESPSQDSSEQDFPEWLKNFQAEEPQIIQNSEDMPDWLKNLQAESEPVSAPSEEIPTLSEIQSDVIDDDNFSHIFDQPEEIEAIPVLEEMQPIVTNGADGWEQVDLADQPTIDELPVVEPKIEEEPYAEPANNNSDDRIPDWVKSVLISQNLESTSETLQETSNQLVEPEAQNANEFGQSAGTDEDQTKSENSSSDEGIISQQTNDELLDWLRGLKTTEEPQKQEQSVNMENELPVEEAAIIDKIDEFGSENETLADILFPNNESGQETNAQPDLNADEIISQPEIGSDFAEVAELDQLPDTQNYDRLEEQIAVDFASKIQTSELHSDGAFDELDAQNESELASLISSGDYDNLSSKVPHLIDQGFKLDTIITTLTSASSEQENNFAFWQCLGDLHSKNNNLNDALLAYQKAEDILLKTI